MPGTPVIDERPQFVRRIAALGDSRLIGMFLLLVVFSLMVKGALGWDDLLPGNDDNMRLAQIRDLLAGQTWWDVSQARFVTEEGGAMHWSRLPDLGPAFLITVLSPFLGAESAEHTALWLWPRLVLMGALGALSYSVLRLGGGLAGTVFALLAFLASHAMIQFQPGRIDHHGFQLALVLTGLAAALAPQARWRSGVVAGLCVIASVSTAIESLPYAVVLVAVCGVFWIARPHNRMPQIAGLGAALLTGALALFMLDAPGLTATRAVCDAYGSFHFVGFAVGGAGLIALALATPHLKTQGLRIGAGAVAAFVAAGTAIATDPSCLGSPYASVNAEAISGWMASVGEARSIVTLFQTNAAFGFALFGFCLAGLGAGVFVILHTRPRRQIGVASLVGLLFLATLVTAWQVRGVMFAHAFASILVGLAAAMAYRTFVVREGTERVLAVAAVLLLAPTSYQAAGSHLFAPKAAPERAETAGESRAACRSEDGLAELAALPPGTVFSPIDLGATILTDTHHMIMAAPYHRNASAILNAIEVFEAAPEVAIQKLEDLDVDYLYVCPGLSELAVYARRAPEGLAAAIQTGETPAGFRRLGTSDDTIPRILVVEGDQLASLP